MEQDRLKISKTGNILSSKKMYTQDYSYKQRSAEYGSKIFAVTNLSARIGAMLSLLVVIAVIHLNDAKIDTGYVYTYHDFRSYRFAFWVSVIGLAYTVLQIPFSIHYMLRKKHLINSHGFLKLDFYADKVVALVLGVAAGAAFGTTAELTNGRIVTYWYDKEKMQNFFNVAYIPAAFLLISSIACGISSLHSSLALIAYKS